MARSSDLSNQARFFGLDIGSLWQDLLMAWRGMLIWPVFFWLWPKSEVRLLTAGGEQVLSRGIEVPPIVDDRATKAANFEAVWLPEGLLLHRALYFPKLQPAEFQAALTLEVQALSPFAIDDTVWTYEAAAHEAASLKVSLTLTARKLVNQHLNTVRSRLKTPSPEVWVARSNGAGFLMLPGFGDARRQRHGSRWRWASAMLVMLVVVLLIAMLVTPSIQLYMRLLQANQAMQDLQKKASPVMQQRETLLRTTEQLDSVAKAIGKPISAMQTLNLITQSLPDDTSLLSLRVQGLKVSMSGQTPNASVLMKQLGGTPGLKDVRAPTPATKPLGATRESFTIECTLDSDQFRPAQ